MNRCAGHRFDFFQCLPDRIDGCLQVDNHAFFKTVGRLWGKTGHRYLVAVNVRSHDADLGCTDIDRYDVVVCMCHAQSSSMCSGCNAYIGIVFAAQVNGCRCGLPTFEVMQDTSKQAGFCIVWIVPQVHHQL